MSPVTLVWGPMPRLSGFEIAESVQELSRLLRECVSTRGKERLQVLYLYKAGLMGCERDLAAFVGRNPSTVYRWLQCYRRGGLRRLLSPKSGGGRTAGIRGTVLDKLVAYLEAAQGFNSYKQVQAWLRNECGLEVSYKVVHATLRYRLGLRPSSGPPGTGNA